MRHIVEFVDKLLPYERDLFLWLNHNHNAFWDTFMMTFSGKTLWIPLSVILLFTLFHKAKWQNAVLFIGCFIILASLCDQISASLIKPFFERLRPTHHPDFMNYVTTVNGYRGGRFGFVSAHAANGFGVATFIALVFRHKWLTAIMFTWAIINSYSRIYLGVHFISDIIGGMLIGALFGFLIYLLFQYCRINLLKQSLEEFIQKPFCCKQAQIIIWAFLLTVAVNIAYSFSQTYF